MPSICNDFLKECSIKLSKNFTRASHNSPKICSNLNVIIQLRPEGTGDFEVLQNVSRQIATAQKLYTGGGGGGEGVKVSIC